MYDLVGIGCGPFNLSIAALGHQNDAKMLFLDKQENFKWHSGMQIENATIQNSGIKDLVSLVDPTNQFSFLNFLRENNRIEEHHIADFDAIHRWEFEQYLKWVIQKLGSSVLLSSNVQKIYRVGKFFEVEFIRLGEKHKVLTKNISIGMGVSPNIQFTRDNSLQTLIHNSNYKDIPFTTYHDKKIAIIGAAQSGLEIALDIMEKDIDFKEISIINRQPFIRSIEDSQFAEETIYKEKSLDRFYKINLESRERLNKDLRFTSDGASPHTIKNLYQKIYINKNKDKKDNVKILNSTELSEIKELNSKDYRLICTDLINNKSQNLTADIIILCTGYVQKFNNEIFDSELLKLVNFESENLPKIMQDFSLSLTCTDIGKIYVLNNAKHAFGVVEPNLSLNAFRAKRVINSLEKSLIEAEVNQ